MAASRAPGADCDEGRRVCAPCPDRAPPVASGGSASRCLSQAPQLELQGCCLCAASRADCLLFAGLLDRGFETGDARAALH
jgi:hypothetical protein